jgi:hypothetical protein
MLPAPALPAQRLAAMPSTHVRDSVLLCCAGAVGWGVLTVAGQPGLAGLTVAGAAVCGVARFWAGGLAARRRRIRDLLVEALAGITGTRELDRRTVVLSRWTRGWPGTPRRVVVRYAPGAPDGEQGWRSMLLDTLQRRLQASYKVVAHNQERCRLLLEIDHTVSTPVASRMERALKDLIGPTARIRNFELGAEGEPVRITVAHDVSHKLAASGYRARIERTFSSIHPGRWRARWDLEGDEVVFELRPTFPKSIWLPPSKIDQSLDVLASYRQVSIPFGIDEDGNEMVWRPAIDPHLMVVGSTGTGKALALDTLVPTPAGWTTMGQIRTGDMVFDEAGAPCRVLMAHDVMVGRPCYRLRFSDGSEIVADAGHLWVTQTLGERRRRPLRPGRMSADRLAVLEEAISATQPGELITIPEAARIAGLDQSHSILRKLGDRIGPAGQMPRPMAQYRFAARATSHPQRVLTADRAAVVAALRSPAARWEARIAQEGITSLALGQRRVSSVELRQAMGGWTAAVASRFFRQHQLTTSHETVGTPRVCRERLQSRPSPGGPVTAYPKAELLRAIADWGQGEPRSRQEPTVRTTEQIASTLRHRSGHANHSIRVCGPIQAAPADLLTDPYVLGAWLGDGTSRTGEITTVDDDILTAIRDRGYSLRPVRRDPRRPNVMTVTVAGLRAQLDAMGLLLGEGPRADRVKRIPPTYLRASIDQRRALLAGLLDTDGSADPQGSVTFTSTSEALAADVRELACSLGYRARLYARRAKLRGRDIGPVWVVSFTTTEDVFWLPRKAEIHRARRPRSAARVSRRYVVAVDPVESVPVRCLTVDSPSALFLVGESFIATHNTVLEHTVLAGVARYGWPIWVVDGKSVEFLGFRSWPNVQVVAASVEDQVAVIHKAWEVMEYRYKLVQSGLVTEDVFEPLMLFVDEYADFRAKVIDWYSSIKVKGEPAKPSVLEKLASIARLGRTGRVHLLFATQRPDAEYFGGDFRDNFRMRISVGRLSPQGAAMMWQDPTIGTTVPRLCPGRATTINDDNRPVEVQTYRVPDPRRVPEGDEQQLEVLEALRPATSTHERLLIKPLEDEVDDDGAPLFHGYRDFVNAEWVKAGDHPDLDPVNVEPLSPDEARRISRPMAMLKLDEGAAPLVALPSLAPPPIVEPDSYATAGGDEQAAWEDQGVFEGYEPPVDLDPEQLTVGDMFELDGRWVTVDMEPDPDLDDPDYVAIGWRDDVGDDGILSIPNGELVRARHPIYEAEGV